MTKFILKKSNNKREIIIKGHANYREYGLDIVCSACSVLGQTFIQSLIQMYEIGKITKLKYNMRNGFIYTDFEVTELAEEEYTGLENAMVTGFLLLENAYEKYVKVDISEKA